jgi:hypothetical protein
MPKLADDIVAGILKKRNLHERGPISLAGKHRVGPLAHRIPKLFFREFLREQAFRKQGIQFFPFLAKARAAPDDGPDPALLFWREADSHGVVPLCAHRLQGTGKPVSGQGPKNRSGRLGLVI